MRVKLYCHRVNSEDDGRTTVYLSTDRELSATNLADITQITITAPYEAFEEDEMPRWAHRYRLVRLGDEEKR